MHSPHLEGEYCAENPTPFDKISFSSNKPVWWKCSVGHRWQIPPARRTRKSAYPSKCPFCSGRRISEMNSLPVRAPYLREEYHPDNPVSVEKVSFGSTKKVKWRCKKHPEHTWVASPNARTSQGQGCPYCAGSKVSNLNSLQDRAAYLRPEYHPDNPIPFECLSYGSKVDVRWICSKNASHTWTAKPNSRTACKSGCPYCVLQHSRAELAIFAAIKEKYPDALNGKRRLLKTPKFELDIYVPHLRKAIEYDGTYYHPPNKEVDMRKNKECIVAKIQLLRIQEAEYEADTVSTMTKIFQWLALPPQNT